MEKVSSLWYRILDENPLPLLHSKARKRRLQFYQSLHLRLLNKLKVCEPKTQGSRSESFPLLHSCKFETSIASLEFTMVEMMNAGILSFSFKNEKLFHRIICFHLRRLRSYFSNYANNLHWVSACCCAWVQSGLQASYSLWANGTALWATVVSGEEDTLTVTHNPSGHSQSLAWPFKEPTFSSSDACYYFRLLLLQQKTTSIYFKVIFKPWIFTGRVKQGMVGRYTFLSLISVLLLYTFRYLQEGYYFFSAFPQLS